MKLLILPAFLLIALATATTLPKRAVNCNGRKFDLSVDNWNKINADKSLRAFWRGGTDEEGVEWPGAASYRQAPEFTNLLGSKLQNKNSWNCSGLPFETSCDAEPCNSMLMRGCPSQLCQSLICWVQRLEGTTKTGRWSRTLHAGGFSR